MPVYYVLLTAPREKSSTLLAYSLSGLHCRHYHDVLEFGDYAVARMSGRLNFANATHLRAAIEDKIENDLKYV